MTRKRTDKEETTCRQARGLALLEVGKSTKEVAELLKVTPRSVRRSRQEAKVPQRKGVPRPSGRPWKLTSRQEKQRDKALDRGVYVFGYAEDYLTLDRIGQVIWHLFVVCAVK